MYRSILYGSDSYLTTSGWRETVKRGYPCRPDGSPLPWMNFAIIQFLEERLTKEMRLFEYGSGYSTLFYASLVGEVISVENDREWYATITRQLPDNAKVFFAAADVDGDYCRAIVGAADSIDIVVVDGRDRVNSFKQGLLSLNETGVIILDDSMRERYKPAHDLAHENGFRAINFYGLKPQGISNERSTLFYRQVNCLGI